MGSLLFFRKPRGDEPKGRRASDARLEEGVVSDAHTSEIAASCADADPEVERRRRLKRSVQLLAFLLVFLGGAAASLVGSHGYMDVRRSEKELEVLVADNEVKLGQVEELRAEVQRLRTDPLAVERIAREELGFIRPGELSFLLPKEEDRRAGATLALPDPPPTRLPEVHPPPPPPTRKVTQSGKALARPKRSAILPSRHKARGNSTRGGAVR